MLGTALYYPHIDIQDGEWLRSAVLFWDEVQTIAPTSIQNPYNTKDTKICESEGYLKPLRCDLHSDILDDLGRRVFKLLQDHNMDRGLFDHNFDDPSRYALMHADKISHEMRWQLEELVGVHPDKISPALQSFLIQSGGLAVISGAKMPPHLRRLFRDFDMYGIHPEKFSRELRHMMGSTPFHSEGEWFVVNGRFAAVYMSALAALLAKEVRVSPLTNEEASSGVNLRCLIDDVTATGPTAAKGALVSVVMEGLRVDPQTPMKKLLAFRQKRCGQLADLSGLFDDLRGKIEKSSSQAELEEGAKALFENKIRPGLEKLKKELTAQTIQSVWEGIQRGITVSAPAGGILAAATHFSGPLLLGAGAFVTLADVSMKSYFATNKTRASSPYTYLLDVQSKFSLPG